MSRMEDTFRVAIGLGLAEKLRLLDCYNKSVVMDGIAYTITTRISACNHYWMMEVYE